MKKLERKGCSSSGDSDEGGDDGVPQKLVGATEQGDEKDTCFFFN